MKALSKEEVIRKVAVHLKNWIVEETVIRRNFKFKTFVEAFSFMTAVALESEKMDHHPDWSNVYNKVSIGLSTHDADGITQRDFDLATRIDGVYDSHVKS
jgi:4a-hydroxytetrahydrobiopterin dehydratase